MGLCVATLFIGLSARERCGTSPVVDEPIYLQMGLDAFDRHRLVRLCDQGIEPLPIYLEYLLPALATQPFDVPFATGGGNPGEAAHTVSLVNLARLSTEVFVGVPLLLLTLIWLTHRVGLEAATLGTLMVVCSPTWLAHGTLATTDACMALTALVMLLTLVRTRHVWPVGLAAGLLWASKDLALCFPPVIMWVMRDRTVTRSMWRWLQGGVVTLATCWGFWLFHFHTVSAGHALLVLPAPLRSVWARAAQAQEGHPGFCLGQVRQHGFWAYYPVAFLLKSTPVEWVLMALVGASFASPRSAPFRVLRSSALVFMGLALTFSFNLGVRYLLWMYPILAILGALSCCQLRFGRSLLYGLVAVQAACAWMAAPDYLGWFSISPGGPPYRLLVDSNLDWGQDLPQLRSQIDKLRIRHLRLFYFGEAMPAAYGIHPAPDF
ncbi:MAG TPA: hypothetical protein VGO93_28450, partial [Candidatus Xenobia bacterium]